MKQSNRELFFFFGALAFFLFSSCTKKDLIDDVFRLKLSKACLKGYENYDATFQSPYQNLVFSDEFNGPEPSDDPSCFTRAPNCRVRLDHFANGSCPKDFNSDTLGQLNRCNWNVWNGFSFWDKSNRSAYRPELVNVSNGTLKLKARYRYDLKNPKCGIAPNQSSDRSNENYYDRQCLVEEGGIDSGDGLPITRGRNFQDGRVEVRVRFPGQVGSAPSVWTWVSMENEGYPYRRSNWSGYLVGEHDLVETHTKKRNEVDGFTSYHDWGPPAGKHIGQSSRDYNLPSGQWVRFGLERGLDRDGKTRIARFYVNDGKTSCVVKEIRQGVDGFNLADWPTYLILNFQAEGHWGPLSAVDGASFEVDYVRMYER